MPSQMWRLALGVFGCVLPACAPFAQAAVTIPQEYSKLIQSRTEIASLRSELFGDSVNLNTGLASFMRSGISLPINSMLGTNVCRNSKLSPSETQLGHVGE